jgi:hypothetical protein
MLLPAVEASHRLAQPLPHRRSELDEFERAFWSGGSEVNRLAGKESLLLSVRDAATAGDLETAHGLLSHLAETDLADPGIVGTKAWIELLQNPNDSVRQVEALRRAAKSELPPTPYLQTLFTRALAMTGHAEEADVRLEAHAASWPSDPEVVLARVAVLQADGRFRDALEDLQSLRTRFTKRTFSALTQEMILASKLRDTRAFQEAYGERQRLEEREPLPGISQIWTHLSAIALAVLSLWAAAVLFDVPTIEWIALGLLLGFLPLHWHVLRNRRLIRGFALIIIMPVLITVAVALWYPRT